MGVPSSSDCSAADAASLGWCNIQFRAEKIENFSLCEMEVGEVLRSSQFSADPNDEKQPKWLLELYPGGCDEESRDCVSLFLRLEEAATFSAKFKLCILNAKREQASASFAKFVRGQKCWGWQKFIRRDVLLDAQNGLLPGDRLTIFCEVAICVDKMTVAGGRAPPLPQPVLGQLLRFVYTGQEPPLLAEQDMAEALLAAADKYQLDRLKAICERQLCLQLNQQNVCRVLTLADRHQLDYLKKQSIEYICLHANEVMDSDDWQNLFSSQPELLKQVFKALASKQTRQVWPDSSHQRAAVAKFFY